MNRFNRQQGSLVMISMFVLAGVAAVGVSLAKMRVAGVEVASEYIGGSQAFNVAESGFQVGLKQFKDNQCNPGDITGAEQEGADGSIVLSQSLGEMGGFKLIFCPMDGSCYPESMLPSDTDVTQVEQEKKDHDDWKKHGKGSDGKNHDYWKKYGKDGEWKKWISSNDHYRKHHKKHTDKREHWRDARKHLKECHGKHKGHHEESKCKTGESSVDDSISYWMITAVDNASGNQRTLQQFVSCDPGEKVGGNLFTSFNDNKSAWDPASMIGVDGMVTFTGKHDIEAEDGKVELPAVTGNDFWFFATFAKNPPTNNSANLQIKFTMKNDVTIKCGDSSNVNDGMKLTLSNATIKCTQSGDDIPTTSITLKCDGSQDSGCKIADGKLHFNVGKFDPTQLEEVEMTGQNIYLSNANMGTKEDNPTTPKPKLILGQWGENL